MKFDFYHHLAQVLLFRYYLAGCYLLPAHQAVGCSLLLGWADRVDIVASGRGLNFKADSMQEHSFVDNGSGKVGNERIKDC